MTPSAEELRGRTIADLVSLEGRTAVVTGGAAGIGLRIAERLAEAGAHVVIGDIRGVDEAVARLEAAGATAVTGADLDVTDPAAITSCIQVALEASGSLDIWVNNAGIYPVADALDITDAQWDAVHDVNLRGAFIGAREAARTMIASNRSGVIVNVSSIASVRAAGLLHYVASKHGLNGLTKRMAVELGPLGIRVVGVAPGMVRTPGMEVRTEGIDDVDIYAEVAGGLPLRRVGDPDDIARAVLFMASDLASFVTGTTLIVDGGDLA